MTAHKLSEWAESNPQRREICSLLNTLQKHGWKLHAVDNGGELIRTKNSQLLSAEHILSVDESLLRVRKGEESGNIFLVLGNEPGAAPCDWSGPDSLDTAIQEYWYRWQ